MTLKKVTLLNDDFIANNLIFINNQINASFQTTELQTIAKIFKKRYFNFYMIDEFGDISNYMENCVKELFTINKYKYSRLWESTQQVYNMIDNNKKNSTITITKSGKQKETNKNGDVISSIDSETSDTTQIGERKTTNKVSPYDSDKMFDSNSSIIGNAQDININRVGGNTRTTKGDDIRTTEFENYSETTTEHTSGNIGVTTSAQMIQGERELAIFSFWDVVIEDLVNYVLIFPYEFGGDDYC